VGFSRQIVAGAGLAPAVKEDEAAAGWIVTDTFVAAACACAEAIVCSEIEEVDAVEERCDELSKSDTPDIIRITLSLMSQNLTMLSSLESVASNPERLGLQATCITGFVPTCRDSTCL